ncbi:MAG: ABC transporter permease [Pedobacter sp.]|nr:MAG: ABC transporter permease [Pedobacter sp.]
MVTGTAVFAAIDGSSINSDNPEIFGNCASSNSAYDFINNSTSGTTVTANFKNEFDQSDAGTYTLNPSTSFTASTSNYTIFVKATVNGTEATKAYQLINNNINTNFGTSGSNTVCLSNGRGQLSFTVDYTSPNGVQYNYPGNLYIINWGDGSKTIYTLCDIIASRGKLTHDYTESSCGVSGGSEPNSYEVSGKIIFSFGMVTLIISVFGLIGFAAFNAKMRIKEIAVRRILGATTTSLLKLLNVAFVKLVLVAMVLANVLAYIYMQKWFNGFAYRIDMPFFVFAAVNLSIILITILTVSLQSIRAIKENPVKALKYE